MPFSLPVLSGREVVRVFESLGWHVRCAAEWKPHCHDQSRRNCHVVNTRSPGSRKRYATKPHSRGGLDGSRICSSGVTHRLG